MERALSETSGEMDEEGNKFHECLEGEDDALSSCYLPNEEVFHDFDNEEHENEPKSNTFKIKSTKGSVVYDHKTKQKRFMSPFD